VNDELHAALGQARAAEDSWLMVAVTLSLLEAEARRRFAQ
jgi:hypothetical protein